MPQKYFFHFIVEILLRAVFLVLKVLWNVSLAEYPRGRHCPSNLLVHVGRAKAAEFRKVKNSCFVFVYDE